jgi:AraC family transcriptional regulator
MNNSISKAVAYIDKNLSEDLTLEMICNHVHLSKYHFCRLFREKTGMSPFKYIIECRISKAKKLLTYTNDSISNIAVATGFSTSANFCNAFRKYEKLSPTDFRARNSKQP